MTSFSVPVFSTATADCEVLCFAWIIFTLANSQGQDQTAKFGCKVRI